MADGIWTMFKPDPAVTSSRANNLAITQQINERTGNRGKNLHSSHLDRFVAVQLDVGSDVMGVALGGPVGGGGGQQMSVVGLHVDGVRVLLAVLLQGAVHLIAVACENTTDAVQFLLA